MIALWDTEVSAFPALMLAICLECLLTYGRLILMRFWLEGVSGASGVLANKWLKTLDITSLKRTSLPVLLTLSL